MIHVVSVSSGIPSAVAAWRVLQTHPREDVRLVFCDTTWEDEDNYRFLRDVGRWLNHEIVTLTDGRTPLQVAEDNSIIPNSMFAPCSRTLKLAVMRRYVRELQDNGHDVTMHLGMDIKDAKKGRLGAPRKNWGEIGVRVDYPLLWKPRIYDPHVVIKEAGIEPPRMYALGYSHANCGGRCIKQGKGDWRRTLTHFPDRFAEVEQWEATMRVQAKYAEHAILKRQGDDSSTPLPLAELRAETEAADAHQLRLFEMMDDMGAVCGVECGVA